MGKKLFMKFYLFRIFDSIFEILSIIFSFSVPPMSLEMSAFMEEIESLHTQGMEVTGPHVSPLPTTPICEVTPNQVTRNIKYLAPKPQGKKLIVKVPSSDTVKPEVCSLPDDHDYYWNEIENQPTGLTQENNQL